VGQFARLVKLVNFISNSASFSLVGQVGQANPSAHKPSRNLLSKNSTVFPSQRFPLQFFPFGLTFAPSFHPNSGAYRMHSLAILLQNQPDPAVIAHMMGIMFAIIPLFILLGLAIIMVPFWFILKKAGFSPWLVLLFIIPFGNLVVYYMLAFSDWKVVPALPPGWTPYPPQPPLPPQA
jgi:hypothetical protein